MDNKNWWRMNKKDIDKLESLLGKVEDHLWYMKQGLPENQKKPFDEQVLGRMYDCSNAIVKRSYNYIQKEEV